MRDGESIREAVERNIEELGHNAMAGRGTAVTRAKLGDGLECSIEDGPWKFTAGMPEKYGGSNAGPNPGVFGRAALASCLAVGYGIWASRLGVPLDNLEVEVQADYNVRGELAIDDDVPPGYLAVRYIVRVESSASEEEVMRLLDTADRYSSWRDDYMRALDVRREVQVTTLRSG